jgi:cobalt-zinc-cadmium efflux system outer membrane protein
MNYYQPHYDFTDNGRAYFHFIAIILLIFEGCISYNPMPLDKATVSQELKPPSMDVVRVNARIIKHPILKPLNFDESDGLSPDEAAVLSVIANTELRAVRDKRGIASAQLLQAGILPNPQVSYGMDFPTGGATMGTINAFALVFSWDLRFLITRWAEIDSAKANAASVDLDVAWQEWQVSEGAKQHVYRLYFLKNQLDVAKEGEKGLLENVEAIKKAVDFGDMTVIDLSAAESALRVIQLSAQQIEQQLKDERIAFNQAIGFPPEQIVPIQKGIEPPALEKVPSFNGILDGIEDRRLDLLALKLGYESQEARVRAAILAQFPRVSIGFSQLRDTTNVVTSGFGITIDLPVFDRNQGHIAIERATRKQLFDEYVDRVYKTQSDIATILADIQSVNQQIYTTQETVKTLQRLVDTYYKAFLEGNADVISYYNARNELTFKQIDVFKLKQTLADLEIALEIAAGRYLDNAEFGA